MVADIITTSRVVEVTSLSSFAVTANVRSSCRISRAWLEGIVVGDIRIELPGKPENINAIARNSYWQVSKERKFWRQYAASVAKFTKAAKADGPVIVHAYRTCAARLVDSDAGIHAIKACIDGLVDAAVLIDDSPEYVRGIFLHAPTKAAKDGLTLVLEASDDA